ncbi:MAG TPA: RDD family protein [Xanthobacteraceae bacterium]|nr:RDD family protein [Xanthobacteraceae bacterium]
MTDSGPATGPGRVGASLDIKPHAYDPAIHPELFDGVLARRLIAFIIDVIIIVIPLIVGWLFIFVFGLVTFGLGWALFWLMSPGSVLWALVYYGMTLGGPASATLGMRAMAIEMRTWYGAPAYFVLGAVHAIVFWISITVLTPLILVVGLLNARHRLLHDMLVGTVLINNPARASALRAGATL